MRPLWAAALCVATGAASAQAVDTPQNKIFPSGFSCPQPAYPRDALRAEATGVTRLRITVEADGKVSDVDIDHPSGGTYAHGLLDQSAVNAVWACRFPPPQGAVRVLATQEFQWVIEEAPASPPGLPGDREGLQSKAD